MNKNVFYLMKDSLNLQKMLGFENYKYDVKN